MNTTSLDIRRLAVEQGKLVEALTALNLGLSSQRSLLKASTGGPAASSEPTSKLIAEVEQRSPPDRRKASMASESAMVDLAQALSAGKDQPLDKKMLRDLEIDNHRLASEVRVAPSGATSVQLAQVETAAARSGIGAGLDLPAKKVVLLEFAGDAGTLASAFNIGVKEAGQIMADFRNTLNLDRGQSLDLGNATHYLGTHLDAEAADIASVVQQSGEAGMASGLKPREVAAFAAALLSTGADKTGAGVAIKGFSTALVDGGSPAQRSAWAQLGHNPGELANELRTDAPKAITDVLEALKNQSVEKRSSLAKTLFVDAEAMLRLAKKPDDLLKAFSLVPDKGQYANDGGSMVQAAEARGRTLQGRWNAHDASQTRLSSAVGNAMAPIDDGLMVSMDTLTDGLSSLAEGSPKAAAGVALVVAAVGSLLGAVAGAVVSEALSEVGKKVLNQAAARLPAGLGGLIADADEGGGKGTKKIRNSTSITPRASAVKASGLGRRLVGTLASAKPFVNKAAAPLMVLSAGYDAYKGLRDGDDKAVGGAVGQLAGTVVGAAIGSLLLPGVGTAIGGMAGSWLGEQLTTPTDRLGAPDQVSKDLSSAQTVNQQINFAPSIQISTPDPATAQQIASLVAQTLEAQFFPMMMTNPLAVRRNAALTDGAS
ncbi:phage tail tape measure protein [Pseudomonas sp. XS1P51]